MLLKSLPKNGKRNSIQAKTIFKICFMQQKRSIIVCNFSGFEIDTER